MLQNARVVAFTVSELLKENQQGGKITLPPHRLGLKAFVKPFDAPPQRNLKMKI